MNFYVIDHHPLVAEALTRMLRNMCPQCQVLALDRVNHLPSLARLQGEPDVLVIDLQVPDMQGLQSIAELRATYPQMVIIVFSGLIQTVVEGRCLHAGATLFIRKDTKVSAIYQRLAKTLMTQFPMRSQQIRTKPRLLTIRQMQLLFAIENGATNLEMASMLGLSPHTIKVHLWRMFQRFGVNSRLQLLRYAYDHGMV